MKELFANHIKEKILPFWMRLVDQKYGGFHSYVSSKNLKLNKKADKTVVQHARLLWTFSMVENHLKNGQYCFFAKQSYDYLMNHLHDQLNGGFYWSTDDQGNIKNSKKITYGLAFSIYGLSEYYRLTNNDLVLSQTMDIFHLIESKAKQKDGAYQEEFDQFWNPAPCQLLADNIQDTEYTLNTTLHLLEAYVNLYDVSKNEEVKESIQGLIRFFENHIIDDQNVSLHPYLTKELQAVNDIKSFGHNIEFSWLMRETLEKLSIENANLEAFISNIVKDVFEKGYHHHYVYNHLNHDLDTSMIWWVQSEAMVGFLFQYEKTKEESYLMAITDIWNTILDNLVDSRKKGEWFWSKNPQGQIDFSRGMAEIWKTPYHNTRALIKLIERMP